MNLIAYLRVSTDRQADEGEGLHIQRETIQRWSRRHGHRLRATYFDEGVSGTLGLEHRVGLAEAFEHLRQPGADGLVVHRLDRLARDLVIQETLLAEVTRLGATLVTTSPAEAHFLGDDPDDPTRRLVRQVLGAISDYERALITLRMRHGRLRKAAAGGYAHGAPPYGYRAAHGVLVRDLAEQQVLDLMMQLRREGRSIRSICKVLNEEGCKPRRAATFQPRVVARILQRHPELATTNRKSTDR